MTTEELGPLRARAAQLHAAAAREKAGALHTYETSARPALKEQAASLKESLAILMREEEALRERLAGMAQRAVAGAHPSVHTGFNVIRARTAADGGPLSLEVRRGAGGGGPQGRHCVGCAAEGSTACPRPPAFTHALCTSALLPATWPLHPRHPQELRAERARLVETLEALGAQARPPPRGRAAARGWAAGAAAAAAEGPAGASHPPSPAPRRRWRRRSAR